MKNFELHSIFARKRTKGNKKKFSWLKKILLFVVFAGLSATFAVGVLLLTIIKDLPNISNINEIIFSQSSTIYDRNGEQLYVIHGDENRKVVEVEEMPDELVFATIAIEDASFFEHHGFSVKGILRAVISEVLNFGAHKSGGSTLTQQFVKNTFLTSEKTYTRKIKELILSLQLEWKFSKDDILGMYLNSIPYGSNAFGVERASLTFFGKNVQDINIEESAILASLPKAPSFYSPYGSHVHTVINVPQEELLALQVGTYAELLAEIGEESLRLGLLPKKLKLDNGAEILVPGRTSLVLNRMVEVGFLDIDSRDRAEQNLAEYKFQKYREEIKAPHFVMFVREMLEKKYGKEFLSAGGLEIYTTLNYELQSQAEDIVEAQAAINERLYGAKNAAMMSVQPQTGEILAMVGSKDYWNEEIDGNVNVMLQRRLPGSSFKPFAYAAAFSSGYSPASVVFDVETDFGNEYKPQNFDGEFRGPISLRKSLGNSLNVPAVKAGVLGGLRKTYNIAKGMGLSFLKEADWYGGALPLGVAEIKPYDMTQAYATFANMGERMELTPILKIVDRNGNILEALDENAKGVQVLDEETAYLVTDVLADADARGPGWNSRLQLNNRVNAVKTGTSNKRKDDEVIALDGWTIGYTPDLVTVAWAGNNDGSVMGSKASGWGVAAPIWKNFMEAALAGTKEKKFEKPAGVTSALVSSLTGKLPGQGFPASLIVKEEFSELNIPKETDNSLEFISVEKISGDLPNEYTPEDAKKEVAVIEWQSHRPYDELWEDPVQEWATEHAEDFVETLGVDEVIAQKPTQEETIHTRANTLAKPEIQITSPKSFGEVNKDGVGVWLDIDSQFGVALVEFYLEGELVDSVQQPPFKGLVDFGGDADVGDSFKITAKVYDTLYNASSSSVMVKLAEDTRAPETEIVFPRNGASLSASSSVLVQTNTYDVQSDIEKVEFYLEGVLMGTVTQAPYNLDITLPKTTGNYSLKVLTFDKASNEAEDEIEVQVTSKKISRDLKVEVPSSIEFGRSVEVQFFAPIQDVAELEALELYSRFDSKEGVEIDDVLLSRVENFDSSSSGIAHYLWVRPLVGDYQIFAKAIYKNGKVLFSSKKRVEVQ